MKEIIRYFKNTNYHINFQWTWWNLSFKKDNILYIKPSWYKILDLKNISDFSKIDINNFNLNLLKHNQINPERLDASIKNSNISNLKPSIETGFHLLLDKYVVHTHNIYFNFFLCMEDWETILKSILWDIFTFIKYVPPGYFLYDSVKKSSKKELILLENHWLIIHSNNWFKYIFDKINFLEKEILKRYKFDKFILSKKTKLIRKHIFPDSIVLDDIEVYSAHNYIKKQIKNIWWKIRYLQKEDIEYIKNMSSEKFRKDLYFKKYS